MLSSMFNKRNRRVGRILRVDYCGNYVGMCNFIYSGTLVGLLEGNTEVGPGGEYPDYDNVTTEETAPFVYPESLEGKTIRTMRTSSSITTDGELCLPPVKQLRVLNNLERNFQPCIKLNCLLV